MQVVRAGCHTFGSVPSQSKMRKAESRPRACSRAVCLQPPLYFCILCFIGKHGGGGFDGFRVIRSPLHAAPAKGKREKGMAAHAARPKTQPRTTCTCSHHEFLVLLIGGRLRLIIHLLAPLI